MAHFLRKVKSTFHASIHNDNSSDTISQEGQAKTRSWADVSASATLGGGAHAQSQAEIQAPHAQPQAQPTPAASVFYSNHNTTFTNSADLSIRSSPRRLRKPRSGIAIAIPRPPSTEAVYDQSVRADTRVNNPERPYTFSPLRRRLVHKASTFSLRSKRWTRGRLSSATATRSSRAQEAAKEEERIKESLLLAEEGTAAVEATYQGLQGIASAPAPAAAPIGEDQAIATSPARESDLEQVVATQSTAHKRNFTNTSSISTIRPTTTSASTQTDDELGKGQQENPQQGKASGGHQDTTSTEVNQDTMASELAAPPVPYTRLKEITESACETALSGVTSYSHADTESWNTTIINNILGALVTETTQQSNTTGGAASTQPQFKYVVNSTIIQHAGATAPATPGEEPSKKTSGRRGMHAASGAYWNNEKDGMWSFKYPGADSKGLDVVVGVIWVWVG